MTSSWAPSASSVRTVSTRLSPFVTDEAAVAMFTTFAERFLPATSKLTRVRVDAFLAVDLLEAHLDDLLAGSRHVFANMVGPDGKLAVAAIDKDRQAYGLRTPEIDQGVHCGANCAARIQDVVDEHDGRGIEIERDVGALHQRLLRDQ